MNEIVYAKWDDSTLWYLAEVISITDNGHYNVLFMDGYHKDDLEEKELSKVPLREKRKPMIGKRFYDNGDALKDRKKGVESFKIGEFVVLCYQPGSGGSTTPSYWCERETGGDSSEREIVEFGVSYVNELVEKYENE